MMKNIMTLSEFFDSTDLPNTEYNLGVGRSQMPQIDTNKFLADVNNNPDISISNDVVDTNTLLPTQSQFNNDKIKSIIMSLRSGNEPKPIIVTNDNYIADGHHRWAAHNSIGTPVPVIRVSTDIGTLMGFLQDKGYVKNKSINESTNIDNMKRQLIDLLRLRVQKSMPISSLGFSVMLQQETQKVVDMSDDETVAEYNKIMVNNDISGV